MHSTTSSSPGRSLKTSSDHALALSVTITLSLLIAIGLPLAGVLPPKYVQALPVSILVPLYTYPNPGAWDWLYDSYVVHLCDVAPFPYTRIVRQQH
jgi:hypothetical protein